MISFHSGLEWFHSKQFALAYAGKPIAPELVDEVIKLELTECPDGGQQLDLANIERIPFWSGLKVGKNIDNEVVRWQQKPYFPSNNLSNQAFPLLPNLITLLGEK